MNPYWWQVVTLHRDIREGRFDESVFAADLGDVARGKGSDDYRDASLFIKKTYLTKGLENLIINVAKRLNGEQGDAVIQLQTPFGGGKTHALLTLYHVIKNRDKIKDIETIKQLKISIPEAKVAVFVGTHADPIHGKTPWGEIAEQLGCYDIIEEHDKKRVAPGKDRINEMLSRAGPTLILMDEILEYIVKANKVEKTEKITHGQTLAFIQELTESIAATKNSVLVLSLPTSALEQYDESAEKALTQLQKISGRVETIYTPVEGTEIYEIIRKRLFEDLGDKRIHRKIADWYFNLYQKLGNDVPPEVREITYREKIEKAYPFHPELIDTLYERWGSIPTFQRTRGILRLLAEVTADAYKKRTTSSLIHSADVNLFNTSIRREFIKHIGNEYDSIIAADIAGENSKAPQIDKNMGSEYEKYHIAIGLATSIFINSFSGGEKKGITLPRLRVAILRESIPSTIVGDAVKKLEEELWYLHVEGNLYAFKNQPNLNRVIVDKEETISDDMITTTIKNYLSHMTTGDIDTYLWPTETGDIPDTKKIKIAILSPEYQYPNKKTTEFTANLIMKAGSSFRVYKNTLFVIALDTNEYTSLRKTVKNYLALQEINKSTSLINTLTKETLDELKTKLKNVQNDIPFKILSCYRHLASLEEQKIKWYDLGIPTVEREYSICTRVKEYLRDKEKILSQVSPRYIMEKTLAHTEEEKTIQDIYEMFMKTPGLPLLENIDVLTKSITIGIKNGIFGIKIGENVYFNEDVESIPPDALIVKKEIAEKIKTEKQPTEPPVIEPTTTITMPPTKETRETKLPKNIYFKAKIPWDKLSSIISGVIRPLKDRGSEPEITIEVKASSPDGFDRTTIDNKVKETLQQIQAEIQEWEEE